MNAGSPISRIGGWIGVVGEPEIGDAARGHGASPKGQIVFDARDGPVAHQPDGIGGPWLDSDFEVVPALCAGNDRWHAGDGGKSCAASGRQPVKIPCLIQRIDYALV